MPLDAVDRLDVAPAELLWGPGDPPERSVELLDPTKLGATADDDLTPVHDDRPYFFQNTKGLRATALAQPGRLWALAGAVLLVRDLEWLDSVSSDAGRLLLITALLAPAGLTIGCPFPVLLAHHGEPARRIASLWAINGAASVAGGIVAVLALRVAGSTHALFV